MKQWEGDNQGNDEADDFGGSDHDNKHVSDCDEDSNNGSRSGQDILGLRLPVYESPMSKLG